MTNPLHLPPHIPTPQLLLPLLECRFSEAVRTSAALCMASTLDCLIDAARRGGNLTHKLIIIF